MRMIDADKASKSLRKNKKSFALLADMEGIMSMVLTAKSTILGKKSSTRWKRCLFSTN